MMIFRGFPFLVYRLVTFPLLVLLLLSVVLIHPSCVDARPFGDEDFLNARPIDDSVTTTTTTTPTAPPTPPTTLPTTAPTTAPTTTPTTVPTTSPTTTPTNAPTTIPTTTPTATNNDNIGIPIEGDVPGASVLEGNDSNGDNSIGESNERKTYIVPTAETGVNCVESLQAQDSDPSNGLSIVEVFPNLGMTVISIPASDEVSLYGLAGATPEREDFELDGSHQSDNGSIGGSTRFLRGLSDTQDDNQDSTIIQPDAGYALDILDGNLDGEYHHSSSLGKGVEIFVIDSGVRPDHSEWGDRSIKCHYNGFSEDKNHNLPKEPCGDFMGHGTFVASNAGGVTLGTAKEATITDVKVFNGNGQTSTSILLGGMESILEAKNEEPNKRYIANLSLGGSADPVLDEGVRRLVDNDILVLVAAGNQAVDACERSPGRVDEVMTIGASDQFDRPVQPSLHPWGTNYGSCVDMIAPGYDVTGADYQSSTGVRRDGGTSFSCPYTAGIAAIFVSLYPDIDQAGLRDKLLEHAVDVVDDSSLPRPTTGLRLTNAGTYDDTTLPPMPTPSPRTVPTSSKSSKESKSSKSEKKNGRKGKKKGKKMKTATSNVRCRFFDNC